MTLRGDYTTPPHHTPPFLDVGIRAPPEDDAADALGGRADDGADAADPDHRLRLGKERERGAVVGGVQLERHRVARRRAKVAHAAAKVCRVAAC